MSSIKKILNSLLKLKTEIIICGDININDMETSNNKKELDNLLNTYNLTVRYLFLLELITHQSP